MTELISVPGVYSITSEMYHLDPVVVPSLSSSIAKMLVTPGTTPIHAWEACTRLNPDHEADDREQFDLGKAAHSLMLHDYQEFEVIDAADWRSKDARAARDQARLLGRIPMLKDQFKSTQAMVSAGRGQLERHEEGRAFFKDGTPEATLIWEDEGVWCRARLDYQQPSGVFYPDYKSTGASADPDSWQRTAYGMGADIQAAFYLRGIRKLGLCERPEFRFVVQENYPPYALSVIGLDPAALDLAAHQVERAISRWRECTLFDRWPGYPTRTCFIGPPAWHEAQVMEREIRQHESQVAIDRGRDAQRPI